MINQRERRKNPNKKKPHRVNKRRKIQSHFGANSRKKTLSLCVNKISSSYPIFRYIFREKLFLFLSGENCVYCLHESESHVGNLRRFPAQDEWHKIKITCRHSFIIQQPQHTRTRYDDMEGMENPPGNVVKLSQLIRPEQNVVVGSNNYELRRLVSTIVTETLSWWLFHVARNFPTCWTLNYHSKKSWQWWKCFISFVVDLWTWLATAAHLSSGRGRVFAGWISTLVKLMDGKTSKFAAVHLTLLELFSSCDAVLLWRCGWHRFAQDEFLLHFSA